MIAVCFMVLSIEETFGFVLFSPVLDISTTIYQPDPCYDEKNIGTHPLLYKTATHFNNCFENDFPSITELQAFISLSFP